MENCLRAFLGKQRDTPPEPPGPVPLDVQEQRGDDRTQQLPWGLADGPSNAPDQHHDRHDGEQPAIPAGVVREVSGGDAQRRLPDLFIFRHRAARRAPMSKADLLIRAPDDFSSLSTHLVIIRQRQLPCRVLSPRRHCYHQQRQAVRSVDVGVTFRCEDHVPRQGFEKHTVNRARPVVASSRHVTRAF